MLWAPPLAWLLPLLSSRNGLVYFLVSVAMPCFVGAYVAWRLLGPPATASLRMAVRRGAVAGACMPVAAHVLHLAVLFPGGWIATFLGRAHSWSDFSEIALVLMEATRGKFALDWWEFPAAMAASIVLAVLGTRHRRATAGECIRAI